MAPPKSKGTAAAAKSATATAPTNLFNPPIPVPQPQPQSASTATPAVGSTGTGHRTRSTTTLSSVGLGILGFLSSGKTNGAAASASATAQAPPAALAIPRPISVPSQVVNANATIATANATIAAVNATIATANATIVTTNATANVTAPVKKRGRTPNASKAKPQPPPAPSPSAKPPRKKQAATVAAVPPSTSAFATATNLFSSVPVPQQLQSPSTPTPVAAGAAGGLPAPSAYLPVPPDWMEHCEEVIGSLETYRPFPVPQNSLEYSTLVEMCAPLQVLGIEQIVNPELWNRFVQTRKDMYRSKSINLPLLSKLGLSDKEVMRIAHVSVNFDQQPAIAASPYADNMALLFHCTRSPNNLDAILRQGLDERLGNTSGVNGLLGRGIYFADDPEKSIKYDGTGQGLIFLCAVLLGDCLSVDHLPARNTFVREPEKGKEQKRNFNDQFFDSIVGRPGGPHNEYVIYNRCQCIPMYQVKYQIGSAIYKTTAYTQPRQGLPSISWMPGTGGAIMPTADTGGVVSSWPYHARNIFFQSMGVVNQEEEEEKEREAAAVAAVAEAEAAAMAAAIAESESEAQDQEGTSASEYAILLEKLDTLSCLGFTDEVKNTQVLLMYENDLDRTVNYLLDANNQLPSAAAVPSSNSIAPSPAVATSSSVSASGSRTATATSAAAVSLIDISDSWEDDEDEVDSPSSSSTAFTSNGQTEPQKTKTTDGNTSETLISLDSLIVADEDEAMDLVISSPPPQSSSGSESQSPPSPMGNRSSTAIAPAGAEAPAPLPVTPQAQSTDSTSTSVTTSTNGFPEIQMEECPICCDEFQYQKNNAFVNIGWRELSCSHKVCKTCYTQIEKVGVTMSNKSHTSVKCPFCLGISGIEVGDCPNGSMTVTEIRNPCKGYEGHTTWSIRYYIVDPNANNSPLDRTAYIPNTDEGRRILGLLKTAWDRRLCFTIGTSNTTGQENVLVWNIHHKTSVDDSYTHGYPDPEYLTRLKTELKAFGIE